MAKGYWIAFYHSISDQEKLSEYGKVARPIIESHGGKVFSRGNAIKVYEAGVGQRVVLIEFENVEKAIATYESAEYQAAAKILDGFVEREIRMVEGI